MKTGDYRKMKSILEHIDSPDADFSMHKKEFKAYLLSENVLVKKAWWDISFPRVAAGTVVAVGVIIAVFLVGPLAPLSKSEVVARAESAHQENAQNGRYYYAKEKVVSHLKSEDETMFLETHEDLETGDVYTKMYNANGMMIDEHAILSNTLYVCLECIQDQMLAGLSDEVLLVNAIDVPKQNFSISKKVYEKVWSLQSNPDKLSRAHLFKELKQKKEVEYGGKTHWKDFDVQELSLAENDGAMTFETVLYFDTDTFVFRGSEDYMHRGEHVKKVSSRVILDEQYSSDPFQVDASRLRKVLID